MSNRYDAGDAQGAYEPGSGDHKRYFRAIHAGMARDYSPMQQLVALARVD